MEKNKISGYLLLISVFTFAAVFIYIVQKSYDGMMKPIRDVKQSVIIKPINPNFDLSTLDEIEKRGTP
ncbi:MAG: hypothetical protein WAV41_00035 [Microgenomates group bacterium]